MGNQSKGIEERELKPVEEKIEWLLFESRLRRGGTALLVLFVVAGFIGLFSKGYISEGVKHSGSISAEYERFGRVISDMSMKVTVNTAKMKSYTVSLDGDFMDKFEVLTLHPAPVRTFTQGSTLYMEYHASPATQEQVIWLGMQPREAGSAKVRVLLDGQDAFTFRQFIYP